MLNVVSGPASGVFSRDASVLSPHGFCIMLARCPHLRSNPVKVSSRRQGRVNQEKLIKISGIPYTIIRSTQFLEFLGGIAASSADGNIVRLVPGLFQPIAADDVAVIVADVALAVPRNGIVEIAGPERTPFNEIVARYLKAVGDPREVVSDPEARAPRGVRGGHERDETDDPIRELRFNTFGRRYCRGNPAELLFCCTSGVRNRHEL